LCRPFSDRPQRRGRGSPASQGGRSALAADAELVARRVVMTMALRFHRGGPAVIVFGNGAGSADAQHVAVEFVTPGHRSANGHSRRSQLTNDVATLTGSWRARLGSPRCSHTAALCVRFTRHRARHLGRRTVRQCLAWHGVAAEMGLLTVALVGGRRRAASPAIHAVDHVLVARIQRPGRGQGGTRNRLPRVVGAGTCVLRAPRRASS